ncbi:MAG: hypothetical protein AAF587_06150 [Bacteroidota bacterium]
MGFISSSLLTLHIVAGFISIILFWIPVFTRKGGKNHRLIGKIYVRLMWVVVISAAILSVENLLTGETIMGAFLGFISLITANPLFYGIAILKQKKGLSPTYQTIHLIFKSAIVLAGIALIAYGISLNGKGTAVLMFIFGGLGVSDLPGLIRELKNPPKETEWFKEHLVGMCTSGIAAYTAFFVFGASRFFQPLFPGYWAVIPWIAPSIVGVIGIRYTVNQYRKKKVIA